ncbi:hypothetical protein ACP70R_031368 [Stipagrostis hirtigluma subsp. patula]
MYRSRLQELCHRRRWAPPAYAADRKGPDHEPRFTATVTVNGAVFRSPDGGERLAKKARDLAAMAAFQELSRLAATPPPPPSSCASVRPLHFKSQLQSYAQKRGKHLPVYHTVQQGPPHEPRFKAVVIIDGQTFESPKEFRKLKEAEFAAAEVALKSLPKEASPPEQSPVPPISYKNLLQEEAQKKGYALPIYKRGSECLNNSATFTSTVEVNGVIFEGKGNTKKKAEVNAAKVAYQALRERKECSSSAIVLLAASDAQSAAQETKNVEPDRSVPSLSISNHENKNDSDATVLPSDTGRQDPPQNTTKKRRRGKRGTGSALGECTTPVPLAVVPPPRGGGSRGRGMRMRRDDLDYVPVAVKASNLKRRRVEGAHS